MSRTPLALLALIILRLGVFGADETNFNVRDFGARGDGTTKDTAAFQKAFDACAAHGGGTVTVPEGIYLIGSVVLSSNTMLKIERKADLMGSPDIADYPIVRVRWEGEFRDGHRALVSADPADNVCILGPGSIFGPPIRVSALRNPRGPVLIELANGTNVVLDGFSTQYQQLWSIHPLFCGNFTARNLTIRSINFNGDGIDVDSCNGVDIEHCNIDTGDDAIALKSGRGMEAVRIGRPTENVVIRDCTLCSSIFAGLALGSEMSGGIRNVRIENCAISGRENAIYIKSREGRGAFMEDITGENLVINRSATFLGIDLLKKGIQASEPVTGPDRWAKVGNIAFRHVRVNDTKVLVAAKNISTERPLDGLTLEDITGQCDRGITLDNVTNASFAGLRLTGFTGDLMTLDAFTSAGMKNSPLPDAQK